MDVDVPKEVLAERRQDWQEPANKYTTGVFSRYAALVHSASEGAILSSTPA